MADHRHRRAATILLRGESGEEYPVSGILEREPGCLTFNNIRLLGNRSTEIDLFRFHSMGIIQWRIPRREEDYYETKGDGWLDHLGFTFGSGVDENTIQEIGNLSIHRLSEIVEVPAGRYTSVIYYFLQRPKRWHIRTRRIPRQLVNTTYGQWKRIPGNNLELRLSSEARHRVDRRHNPEVERIVLAAIEFRPARNSSASEAEFEADAEDAWRIARAVLIFWLRQPVHKYQVLRVSGNIRITDTWNMEIEPPAVHDHDTYDEPIFGYKTEDFVARAIARLRSIGANQELVHAAAHGYCESFHGNVLESGITSTVEAIERLVCLFEEEHGLTRNILNSSQQRSLSRALRGAARSIDLEAHARTAVQEWLSSKITLQLGDRILRMAKHRDRALNTQESYLFEGVARLISVRNALVHGRLVEDLDLVRVEVYRARAIFELLFTYFLGLGKIDASNPAERFVRDYDDRVRRTSQ